MTQPMARRCRKGFTIIEILIVVVILGLLAAVVLTFFGDSRKDAQQVAFISDVRIFGNAARVYWVRTGEHLEDSASGALPAGWDSYGVQSAFGVDFANGGGEDRDDAYMLEIDRTMDNGDLSTGRFRKIAPGRYYFILMQ